MTSAGRPNPWDLRYAGDAYKYGRDPNDFLREMAGSIPSGPVLSLAEGEGRNAVFLAGLGHRVTGVDASAVAVDKGRRLATDSEVASGVHFVHADLAEFPIEREAWAGVVSIFAHLPPHVRRSVHRRVVDGLEPGGVFILEAYTPDQLAHGTGGPPTADLMMDLETLREELSGLKLDVAREVERDIHEGALHHGRSSVVQIVGRKPG
ncbi:MAG: class I SAM-dependent methyltransferase [Gemmatimonadota bacterium]|nr:class I SAM-dependent methyltransferase [Gemmatimonadota bacterium]